jgi:O-antigen ligase
MERPPAGGLSRLWRHLVDAPASDRGVDRGAMWLLGFGLVASCWIGYLSLPIFSFYKEWVFVVALALAALSLAQRVRLAPDVRHPPAVATAVVALGLLVHALITPGAGAKSALMGAYAFIFLCAVDVGRGLAATDPLAATEKFAWSVFIAALGSVVFAALQFVQADVPFPILVARSGDRISGNLAQANHIANLLWLGAFATAFLHDRGRLQRPLAIIAVLLMLAFSSLTGSRMVWLLALISGALGIAFNTSRSDADVRRLARSLVRIAGAFVVITLLLHYSGLLSSFNVVASGERLTDSSGEKSNALRFWIWRSGLDAALAHPLLGVGPGHYVAHAWELAMATPDSPRAAADSHAHNLFIHFAAELGIPIALAVAACVALWLVGLWKQSAKEPQSLLLLAMGGVILIHSNLEYPLWYAYFLILLGLVAGLGSRRTTSAASLKKVHGGHVAALTLLAGTMLAYFQYAPLERAMQVLTMQVSLGAAPQPSAEIDAALAQIPPWSPYRDMKEAIELIVAEPTKQTAPLVADRCERFASIAPSPYLLGRCAIAFQVAGRPARAQFFAESICKMYPGSAGVLVDSISLVGRNESAAATIKASCLTRSEAKSAS